MAEKERRPEGKEGAGAHQEGLNSEQAGQTNRSTPGDNQKHEHAIRQEKGEKHSGAEEKNQGQWAERQREGVSNDPSNKKM